VSGADFASLCAALVSIERLGEQASGFMSFGTAPSGGIFVEQGRVCWVAASGLQQRLRDLLRLPARMTVEELDQVHERCRRDGRHLGQTLVEEGRIAAHDFELALRRHSAECLVDLCRTPRTLSWSPRRGASYAPRFTFRPVDLLLDASALIAPKERDQALAELTPLAAPGLSGAAFIVDGAGTLTLPLAEVGGALGVEQLCDLGKWALTLPRASREFGAPTQFTLAATAGAETLAVWWRESRLFVVCCGDRQSAAVVTAHHLRKP